MDSKTIIKALELVIEDEVARRDMNQPAFTAKELVDIRKAIDELIDCRTSQYDACGDCGVSNDVRAITYLQSIDIMNMLTYDEYGRDKRMYGDDMTFDIYKKTAGMYMTDNLPNDMYEDGYYFLQDLWADNEEAGYNNLDGSFRKDVY